jgi:hypothetical protein
MVLDPSTKTQVVGDRPSFPNLDQAKQKKKETNGKKNPDQGKSPFDKMEAVRSYARRRGQNAPNETNDQSNQKQKHDILDAASVDSGCSSEKSADGDMRRVEQILRSVHIGKTRAAGCPTDLRAARRLHYVVAHGQGTKAPQKKHIMRDNMNQFYTPSLDTKTQCHPRTKSVPSSWQPRGELKTHPKYRTPADGVCKYYCRNYPDYLREMQMERLLKKQRYQQAAKQESEGVVGHDLRDLVKPSSPNKYNQQYSFACVNVKQPVRLPKLMDNVSVSPETQHGGINIVTDRRNNRKKDQNMSCKDIVNLRTKIRTTRENGSHQYSSPENVMRDMPVRVPCPPQTTGMQKYFDRESHETRIRQGYGALTYTAKPRAAEYVNGGVISYRGGKETVYMLKELGDPGTTQTPGNTAAEGSVVTTQKLDGASGDSPNYLPPVTIPRTDETSGGDLHWVGKIYSKIVTVPHQNNGNIPTQSAGQNGGQAQTPRATENVTSNENNAETSDQKCSQPEILTEINRVVSVVDHTDFSQPIFQTEPIPVVPVVDQTDTMIVETSVAVEQAVISGEGNTCNSPPADGEAPSKVLASLLSVPMLHAERIRTLEEGFEGKDGDLSIPEIRMIAATPLPPDYEV